jgi:acyl-coenzyme A thioesterase PaaI-like protein
MAEEKEELTEISDDEHSLKIYEKLEGLSAFGEVVNLAENHAEVLFRADESMSSDEEGLIHPGFVFSSAAFCALAAINDPYSVIISSDVKFLSPLETGNEVHFFAKVLQQDGKKREVKINGTYLGLKVFEGVFHVAVFEKHILKMKISGRV